MGRMDKKPSENLSYDPQDKPWFKSVIKGYKPIWTKPYAYKLRRESGAALALGYAQPFRDDDGQVLGAMNAELTLDDITLFLEKLRIGKTGKAFLIDQAGRLIATSTGVPVTNVRNYPIIASESADRQIAAAGKSIKTLLIPLTTSNHVFNSN